MRYRAAHLLAVLAVLAAPAAAHAVSVLALSELSSDETPAALFTGRLTFTVSGDSLVLDIANNTAAPTEFFINQVYFNATANVTGLTLADPVEGWTLVFGEDVEKANGFGYFDAKLATGDHDFEVAPGATKTFSFDIQGLAPLTDADFVTELSARGNPSTLGAAKFVRGPDDDSGFGSGLLTPPPIIPEPPIPEPLTLTACLLGFGALGLKARRRMRG